MHHEIGEHMIERVNWGDGILFGAGGAVATFLRARALSHATWLWAAREAAVFGLYLGLVFAAAPTFWAAIESVAGQEGVSLVATALALLLGGMVVTAMRRGRRKAIH